MTGPCIRRSPCRNPPQGGKNEPVEGPPGAPTKGSNIPIPSSAVSWTPTPVPTLASALLSTDESFKQFMKAYLESNQRLNQPLAERKRPLKAKVPDVYYGKSHLVCYQFCQKCEDYFKTFWATETNQTLFAASFLCKNISVQ